MIEAAGIEAESRGRAAPTLHSRWLLLGLLLAALGSRLIVFPVNENLYGDAVSRTELAERWTRAPHLITAFGDGAAQYGPLHLYMIGAALRVFDREDAGRVVSLFFGVLTVVPLFLLTRRYFGQQAATWACLGFAVWGMHVQISTTAASEAVGLCLVLGVLALYANALAERSLWAVGGAALLMNMAAAVRYDAWGLLPILAAVPAFSWRDRWKGVRTGLVFALLCLPFPLAWMYGNAEWHGDPFYPFAYIDDFHREWIAGSAGGWREAWLRAQGIGFWPAMALITLTPGIGLLGMVGMTVAWRSHPETRWLIAVALAPLVHYAFRTTVLFDFVPLARFAVVSIALLLPFVGQGFSACLRKWGAQTARRIAGGSIALAVVVPVAIGLYTFRADSPARDVLRTVSPTSTNPQALMRAAAFLKREVAGTDGTLAIDSDRSYRDIQVAFFSGIPEERLIRLRWPRFRERVVQAAPDYLVRFDDGRLGAEEGVRLAGARLSVGDVIYEEAEGFAAPVHVYRRLTDPSSP